MTELVSRTVLPVIPYIRVLATPWNCQSLSATLLLLWSLPALTRDPTHLRGHLSHLTHACRKTPIMEAFFIFPPTLLFHPSWGSQKLCFSPSLLFIPGLWFWKLKSQMRLPFLCFWLTHPLPESVKPQTMSFVWLGVRQQMGQDITILFYSARTHTYPPASKLHRDNCCLASLNAPLL